MSLLEVKPKDTKDGVSATETICLLRTLGRPDLVALARNPFQEDHQKKIEEAQAVVVFQAQILHRSDVDGAASITVEEDDAKRLCREVRLLPQWSNSVTDRELGDWTWYRMLASLAENDIQQMAAHLGVPLQILTTTWTQENQ